MKQQRALWVSTSKSTPGGVATYVRDMEQTPLWKNWDIHHVATHRKGGTATKIAAYVASFPVYFYQLAVFRPTVVHIHVSSYGSFVRKYIFELIARALRRPVVLHVHGSDFRVFYDRGSTLLQAAMRDSLRGAKAVIALGNPWGEALRGITADARILVIPNAVELSTKVNQFPDGEVQVLFLGEIGERKGTFTLLDAWKRMVDAADGPVRARLTIVGHGDSDRARKQVADLGIGDTVEVLGWVTMEQRAEIVNNSQILALPSLREGQPMAILEAMAKGMCVISCPVGGIPDQIPEGCGLLVTPGEVEPLAEALTSVLRDDQLRARLGTGAWERVRDEFDIDVIWRRFDALYREVAR
ncbi:glycosyltransferase family 4 protein [Nocardia huaxiensis]|uniref:glycosyltransferase family 4 protein n=1 Tax=Nocardia huaxiensis TaxID=2755382 RepID=UPI001E4A8BDC|nr:glycosyltransferase family 4 protein [Nocardia huaxiensis]UFS98890.1 glycosyltransferase family 4 protein [Nocardia huaxiensis]